MPIHVLKLEKDKEGKWDYSKVIEWADEYVSGKDYVVLMTEENEVILEPRKSTRPLDFGYVKVSDPSAAYELAGKLAVRYGLTLLDIKALAWDIEKPPWVRVPIAEE
jgi:hypothetical protein